MLSHLHGVSYAAVHGEAATASGGDGGPVQLVGLLLCVLVRKELLPHVRGVRSEVVRTGLLGAGNKGAVALRLALHGESFCFVNVHLPSGASPDKRDQRNATLAEVLERLASSFAATPSSTASSSAAAAATAAAAQLPPPLEHHACFLLGDLNYRLTLPNVEVRWLGLGLARPLTLALSLTLPLALTLSLTLTLTLTPGALARLVPRLACTAAPRRAQLPAARRGGRLFLPGANQQQRRRRRCHWPRGDNQRAVGVVPRGGGQL